MGYFQRKPLEVEAHIFNGSSSAVGQFVKWIEAGVWEEKEIQTRDCGRSFDVNGSQAFAGDYIVKAGDTFTAMSPQEFSDLYEAIEATDRLPGEYKAKNVLVGDKVRMWATQYEVKKVSFAGEDVVLTLEDGSNVQLRGDASVTVIEVRA